MIFYFIKCIHLTIHPLAPPTSLSIRRFTRIQRRSGRKCRMHFPPDRGFVCKCAHSPRISPFSKYSVPQPTNTSCVRFTRPAAAACYKFECIVQFPPEVIASHILWRGSVKVIVICAHDSARMHGRFGRALARFVRSSRFILLRNELLECYFFRSKRDSTVFFSLHNAYTQ